MNLEDADGVVETAAHVVEFRLGEEVCAIDIDAVDSIVESKQVTRVPRAPESVEGVMDLRGETTAIVDPREFLAIEGDHDGGNVLVLDRDDDKQKIGLRVAEVTEVSSYGEHQVDRGGQVERSGTDAVEDELVVGVIRKGATRDDEADDDRQAGAADDGRRTDVGEDDRTDVGEDGRRTDVGDDGRRTDVGQDEQQSDDAERELELVLYLDVDRLVDAVSTDETRDIQH